MGCVGSSLAVGLPTVGVLVGGIGSQCDWVLGHNYWSGSVLCVDEAVSQYGWMFVLGLWGLMLTHWWASKPLVLMVLAGISVIVTEWAPQNDCYHFLCLQGSFQWPLGGSPRWAVDSDPDVFQVDFFSVLTQNVRFFMQSLTAEFLFPISLPLSCLHVSCPSNWSVLRACLPA